MSIDVTFNGDDCYSLYARACHSQHTHDENIANGRQSADADSANGWRYKHDAHHHDTPTRRVQTSSRNRYNRAEIDISSSCMATMRHIGVWCGVRPKKP